MRPPGLTRGSALWLCLLASTALLAVLAAPAQAAKKPDLVVTNPKVGGEQYALQGDTANTFFTFRVRNRGKAHAKQSVAGVFLRHAATEYPLGDTPTAELDTDEATVFQTVPGTDDPPLRFNFKLGAYTMKVCADTAREVSESHEDNNCRTIVVPGLEPEQFFVVRETWTGTLTGIAVLGNVTETYRSPSAKLVFAKPLNTDGLFEYHFAGSVTYKDKGGAGDCTYAGGSTRTFGPGGAKADGNITFDYLERHYSGTAAVDDVFYKIHYKCGFAQTDYPGPFARTFLALKQSPLPFGATEISGSNSSSAQNWVWSFH